VKHFKIAAISLILTLPADVAFADRANIAEMLSAYSDLAMAIEDHSKIVDIVATKVGAGGAILATKIAVCEEKDPSYRENLNSFITKLSESWPDWKAYEVHVNTGFQTSFSKIEYEGCEYLTERSFGDLGLEFLIDSAKISVTEHQSLLSYRAGLLKSIIVATAKPQDD